MRLPIACFTFLLLLIAAAVLRGRVRFLRPRTLKAVVPQSPGFAMALVFVVALMAYAAPSAIYRVPSPVIHDEFAYLLQGDTFYHGRLSNPSHPMARFFETFHVLQSPTYAAKFPPALGIVLAAGYVLGLPLAGVWLSLAIGMVAIHWMLRAVVPNRLATLITLLSAIHPTVVWFSQSYWGGGVSILGGALLAGTVLRTLKHRSDLHSRQSFASWGLLAGLGAGMLALSRPFEGMLFVVACGFAMLIAAWRRGFLRPLFRRFVPAAIVIPLLSVGWFMYYDWRVTGRPLVMPYVVHTARYMVAPLFFWQSIPPTPAYPNEQMQQFHLLTEYTEYADAVGWPEYWRGALMRATMITWAYLRPAVLLLPLVAAIVAARRSVGQRRIVLPAACICGGVILVHVLCCPWMRIAYMAPLFGFIVTLIAIGARHIGIWRWHNHPFGRGVAAAMAGVYVLCGTWSVIDVSRNNARSPIAYRDSIIEQIRCQPGKHLVLVHYSKSHSPMMEWVYNGADIDSQNVIFARDLGDEAIQPLLSYYGDRTAWLLEVEPHNATLMPYAVARSHPSSDSHVSIAAEP